MQRDLFLLQILSGYVYALKKDSIGE